MQPNPSAPPARVPLRLLGEDHVFSAPLPPASSLVTDALPAARALSDQATAVVVDRFTARGTPISCGPDCSACCHHMIAVSYAEAKDIADLVTGLPEERQREVRSRFAANVARLERAGLLDRAAPRGDRAPTIEAQRDHKATVHELSRRYFALKMPCPFLDNHRCGIYERRPMVCREHLVISPAENCADPAHKETVRVEARLEMTGALARLSAATLGGPPQTIPLVLALEWAERHGHLLDSPRDGAGLFADLLAEVDRRQSNPPAGQWAASSRAPVTVPPAPAGEKVAASIDLAVGQRRLQLRVEVPSGPMPARDLLPLARGLCDAAAGAAAADAAAHGQPVSCARGCHACCHHLVPLSTAEARHLAALVEDLPSHRREPVLARFAEARRRIQEAGLLAALQSPAPYGPGEPLPQGRDYFNLQLPCPFLEEGACSIYDERPLACREHLVSSPAAHCAAGGNGPVETVPLPLASWCALARTASPREDERVDWVPLVLAPEWARHQPEAPPPSTGPALLQSFFAELTGKRTPEGP